MSNEYIISRELLNKMLPNPRAAAAFEKFQQHFVVVEDATTAIVADTQKLNDAAFVTLSANADLPNERVLSFGRGMGADITANGIKLKVLDSVPTVQGGFKVNFVATGDAQLALPPSGTLVNQEWVLSHLGTDVLPPLTGNALKVLQVNAGETAAEWAVAGSGGAITLIGDVTGTGSGVFATTIANDVVTNAKLANMATATFKGRATAGAGDPEDLNATQATSLLNVFASGAKGLAPASGGGTTNFLRADGVWASPGGLSGLATITLPTALMEWEQTVAAVGVTAVSRIMLCLAPALDTDENDPAMLAVNSLSATPSTDQITISMAFAVPAQGAIKLNWSAT